LTPVIDSSGRCLICGRNFALCNCNTVISVNVFEAEQRTHESTRQDTIVEEFLKQHLIK